MPIIFVYNQGAAAANGPTISDVGTISVEACDVVEATIPKNSVAKKVDIQPADSADIDLISITSDTYTNLSFSATIETQATAGSHISASSPSTDISGQGAGAKLQIRADAATTFSEITIDATGLNTGQKIATAIQDAIQALGGVYTGVTFSYADAIYTCVSGTTGVGSKIRIEPGSSNDMCQALKIGTAPT